MLSDLVADVVAAITDIPNIGVYAGVAPANVSNQQNFIVYPVPGTATPDQHSGRAGGRVYGADDEIVIERHVACAKDRGGDGNADALPVLEAVRAAIWAVGANPRIVKSIATDHYGFGAYAGVDTFMFRLIVAITHFHEVGQ